MAKLTQKWIKAHARAESLLRSDRVLNLDDIADILSDWHEGATHSNAATSAFFTPFELAMNFALEVPSGGRILDICSGIGMLRSEEHTSELQSLMRNSYAVFCLKKKKIHQTTKPSHTKS